jgi:uncharacterized membrane protein YheB (UPF0754 family)
VKTILSFIVPPLAGAIIGFVTNVVAIRMLFRPLHPIRIFGIRLPFTPGILPKNRHKLAQSIGGMVERELITAEILRKRLERGDVRHELELRFGSYIRGVMLKLNVIQRLVLSAGNFDSTLEQKMPEIVDELIVSIDKILSAINTKELVSERIDSLDMLRVERIVLDVMADQFKWIDIFGAILGFLIGWFQVGLGLLLK